jgi:hypothetical protein
LRLFQSRDLLIRSFNFLGELVTEGTYGEFDFSKEKVSNCVWIGLAGDGFTQFIGKVQEGVFDRDALLRYDLSHSFGTQDAFHRWLKVGLASEAALHGSDLRKILDAVAAA